MVGGDKEEGLEAKKLPVTIEREESGKLSEGGVVGDVLLEAEAEWVISRSSSAEGATMPWWPFTFIKWFKDEVGLGVMVEWEEEPIEEDSWLGV